MNESYYVNQLQELLEKSIKELALEKAIAMAFSGGLDSSVLAKLFVNLGYKVKGYVAGVKNSRDVKQAEKVANEIGIELRKIILSEKDIEEAIGIQGRIIKKIYDSIELKDKETNDSLTPNAIPISFNLPLFFVAKNSKENEIFVSQGPDEMLGGYKRHQKMNEKDAVDEMQKNTGDFLKYGIKQNLETAKYFGKEFVMPYLDKDVVKFCLNLPYNMRIDNHRKYILRKLALKLGISEEIAFNEKKAAQYGSGIIDVMKKIAKKKGHHISVTVREKMNLALMKTD
ncbi:MAG: asparagine synthase-related protein [Nanoarchaeota archaeon]